MRASDPKLIAAATLAVVVCAGWALPAGANQGSTPPTSATETEATGEESAEAAPPRADLSEANGLVRTGSYAEADKVLATLQEEFPDDPALLLMRGELLLALGKPVEARTLLERSAEIDPELPRVHFQLATILQGAGEADQALAAYAKEIELNEDEKVQVMARLNRSMLLQEKRDWLGSATELETALELEPQRLEGYGDLASLYLRADRPDDAARMLLRGMEVGFRSARHFYSLGAHYYKNDSFDQAAGAFQLALEIEPTHAEAARSLAVSLDEMGREDESVQHFRRYLELRPDAKDAEEIAARIRAAEDG